MRPGEAYLAGMREQDAQVCSCTHDLSHAIGGHECYIDDCRCQFFLHKELDHADPISTRT